MVSAEPAPQTSDIIELRRPGSVNDVVRLGPTVTQVAGFGPQAEVVAWLADAMSVPPLVIGADAFDDLNDSHRHADHLAPDERDTLVDRVLELAERAREIESVLAAAHTADGPDAAEELADGALALAVEWDALGDAASARRSDTASREIDLRARTADVLGRLAGSNPASDLRDYADAILRLHPNPDNVVVLRSELDRIEAEGRDLVARVDAADGIAMPAVRVDEMFGAGTCPLVIDGDLLYAVAPTVHDLLLDKLRAEADRRRVVIVLDDTLDAWLATVHGSSLWTTGHLHLVAPPDEPAKGPATAASPGESTKTKRGRKQRGLVGTELRACMKHPSEFTRVSCGGCGQPFCSACLLRVNTKDSLLCMDCALQRGTGVRRPRR
ncbi:MAG TPA: hypothetical protein VGO03_01440 [Acidimicrobiia bacterium]